MTPIEQAAAALSALAAAAQDLAAAFAKEQAAEISLASDSYALRHTQVMAAFDRWSKANPALEAAIAAIVAKRRKL